MQVTQYFERMIQPGEIRVHSAFGGVQRDQN